MKTILSIIALSFFLSSAFAQNTKVHKANYNAMEQRFLGGSKPDGLGTYSRVYFANYESSNNYYFAANTDPEEYITFESSGIDFITKRPIITGRGMLLYPVAYEDNSSLAFQSTENSIIVQFSSKAGSDEVECRETGIDEIICKRTMWNNINMRGILIQYSGLVKIRN